MAPRRKKQKTKRAPAASDATVRSTTQPAIDRLPTEVLQMCFEYLSFHDLIRCRHVCGKWFLCIPGDDTELRKILFLTTNLPPWTHELHVGAADLLFMPLGHTFAMKPSLSNWFTTGFYPKSLQINPILRTVRLSNLAYSASVDDCPNHPDDIGYSFRFSSMEQLRERAKSLESRVDEGLWTDMLICDPPVQKAELHFAIYASCFGVKFTRTLVDNRGIRFRSLIDSLRSLLKEVADKLTIHKVTLRYKRIIEIFDWLGDYEEGDSSFLCRFDTTLMETRITKEGHGQKVWSRLTQIRTD